MKNINKVLIFSFILLFALSIVSLNKAAAQELGTYQSVQDGSGFMPPTLPEGCGSNGQPACVRSDYNGGFQGGSDMQNNYGSGKGMQGDQRMGQEGQMGPNPEQQKKQLEQMKRGMKGMESALKMFEKQLTKLTKQGITAPSDIQGRVDQLKAIFEKVKNIQSIEDIQSDLESMPDLMDDLNQDRQQLETLARWPQTLKQIDRQMAKLNSALKRSKLIVTNLAKKGIDIQRQYALFEEAVNKLKTVRDDAVAQMSSGNSEAAFSNLEDSFFDQMDDVWQYQKVIMTMSNLGRFASEFKQGISKANYMIKSLKRNGTDTSELEELVSRSKNKGQEVLDLLKAGNLDEETVTGILDDLENLKQEFEDKVSELTGQENDLPWEQGPNQFKQVNLPQGFDKFFPKKAEYQNQQ